MNKILPNLIFKRNISTTDILNGKKNFRKFLLYNKRGPRIFKENRAKNPESCLVPIDKLGVRDVGYKAENGEFVVIPEMVPELIVPDLTNCKLKPYVSYKCPDIYQSEFTSEDLFNAIYGEKIVEDFKKGELNEDGTSKNPSIEEKLTKEEAWANAKKTGSDVFYE